ncbi:MAG: TonB family protein [Pseudomonadota bacterium]
MNFATYFSISIIGFFLIDISMNPALAKRSSCAPALEEINPRDRQPKLRIPPKFPEQCMAAARLSETVHIVFDVSSEGNVTNLEVLQSTNSCFNTEAIQAVERWRYECVPNGLKGVETTMTFQLADEGLGPRQIFETSCSTFHRKNNTIDEVLSDRTLLTPCNYNPNGPLKCVGRKKLDVQVVLLYDISSAGHAENVRIERSKNQCFSEHSMKWLARVQYAPSAEGFSDIAALLEYSYSTAPRD